MTREEEQRLLQEAFKRNFQPLSASLLTPEQRKDVDGLRARMNKHLVAEVEAFYSQHPELEISYSFTCDAKVR